MTEVFLPRTLSELWALRRKYKNAALYAGGSDLLVRMRAGGVAPAALICLERLAELHGIEVYPEEIAVGAAVNHSRLLSDAALRENFPVLVEALRHLGSPHIRNIGTLGGNIMTASPAGDSLPPLYVLRAEVELQNAEGKRRLPISAFILGPGRTRIAEDEILSRVFIPRRPVFAEHFFAKVGLRRSLSIAVVSLAALCRLSAERTIMDVRLAWGSVGPTIVILPQVEAFLRGKTMQRELLAAAADLVRRQVAPINDIRAGADYRRRVAGQLLLRLDQPRPAAVK
ncbi:MAG: xanthine dehydrogenase family protein subunit M [Deltaproteobacteria bacterium]|nr:xanthine dehydrogenase family protein subunit M [Deltaproteobacteria bacterium]